MSAHDGCRGTWGYQAATFPSGYLEQWEPVLAGPALRLLDLLEAELSTSASRPSTVVDIGTGTGLLALEALRRWPAAHVVAVDPARAMLDALAVRARETGPGMSRLTLREGSAEELPIADSSVDLAVSSFVFQLVRDRPAALREARRVLAPGGWLAYVTWLAGARTTPAADAIDEVLGGPTDTDWSGGVARAGDVPSVEAAGAELRDAGFVVVRVAGDELRQAWSPERYLTYVECCRNAVTFVALDDAARSTLRQRLREALSVLPAESLVHRAPVVYAVARGE